MISTIKKEYYNLNELVTIVDLKIRALKYRMLYVKVKYKNKRKLLFKKGKSWNIHWTILFEFDRIQLTKYEKSNNFNTLVTISPYGNYDYEALVAVVYQVYNDLKKIKADIRLHYFIEQGERGLLNHIHFITNLTHNHEKMIIRASKQLIICNTDVDCIYEKWKLLDYLKKEIKAQGELTNIQ
jgi:hypothetical protein